MSLTGKIAIVTGSGTGIGKGVAIELSKRGAKVAIHYNQSDAGALNTKQQIDEFGGESIIVQANAAYKKEIDQMVKKVANHFGKIDILVNNAALQLNTPFFEFNEDEYDKEMHINLKGYWQCMQSVVPYMKLQRSGRIIFISSVHGKRPTDFDVVYGMTKGGLRMLARESAIELGRYGITVNTIEPGYVNVGKGPKESELSADEREQLAKDLLKRFPMGRPGKPADIASMVCYIALDESEFMNGASIRLDGASMLL